MQVADFNLSLTDDLELLSESLGLGLRLARGLDGLDLGLEVVKLAAFLLSEGFVFDLALLKGSLGFLLVLVGRLLRLGLLHLCRDLDCKGHQLLEGLLSLIIDRFNDLNVDICNMK